MGSHADETTDSGGASSRTGWVVVAAVVVIMAAAAGVGFYGSTIYIASLVEAPRSFSVTLVSVATGVFMLVSGLGGIIVAWLMERSGPRTVLVVGALVQAGALVALGRVQAEALLVVTYAVMGLGFAGVTVVPAGRLVAAWFVERRTLAMSVAFMGLPLGGMLVTPLVSRLVETRGFTEATVWLAAGLVTVVLPLAVLAREPGGQAVDHRVEPAAGHEVRDEPARRHEPLPDSVAAAVAVRTRWFVVVTVALSLGMVSQIGAVTHMYNAVSQVQGAAAGAAVISTITFASLTGRVIGSWGLERLGLSRSAVLLLGAQAVSLVAVVLWRDANLVFPAAVAFGLTLGNLQVIQPLLLVERFGAGEFAEILAVGNLFITFGMAVGPLVVGFGVDHGAGYATGLLLLAGCSALAAVLMALAARIAGPRAGRPEASRPGDA